MTQEEMRADVSALAHEILRTRISLERAREIKSYLDRQYPYGSEGFDIRSRIMIDTGAGETLAYDIMAGEYLERMQKEKSGNN